MTARDLDGFVLAGSLGNRGLNLSAPTIPESRKRHPYGAGPFARLVMPSLPNVPGLYLWELDGTVVYVGQTRTPLAKRLGTNGYSTISAYNTLSPEPGRKNGGQQTNCRVNGLANAALVAGGHIAIWYRVRRLTKATAARFSAPLRKSAARCSFQPSSS